MKKNKKLAKKFAAIATVSVLAINTLPLTALGYGEEVTVDNGRFRTETDSSADFISWRSNIWDAGESADSGKIALTPGKTEKDLNFAWYSQTKGTPAVRVWKSGQDMSTARVFTGKATEISAENWQGSTYAASNKVTIENYFEENTNYYYQYTDNYTNGTTIWSISEEYNTADADNFSVILTGDPQVGASESSTDYSSTDNSAARDTYNWNKTMQKAFEIDPDAAFLLSAGDQIDKSGATSDNDKKTRESEYAGYLYPSVFRSLPIASTIGNHDMAGIDYTNHFNNPNSQDNLGATAAGGDYYFSYGDVLFISLNSNNRNQAEHRELLKKAVESNEDAVWKVVIFHSDIYGSGQPHADTDAAQNRIIFAPLMDEFDIDVCLTGHDHTYSRSYQILDGNVIDYDISNGSVTDPEGTMYVTTGSGSGSKYYNLLNYTPYYIADRTNVDLPAFSTIDFTDTSLTIKTYDYNGNQYADSFTIKKTSDALSVDEVIEKAESALKEIDETKYTEESVKALKAKLETLKQFKAAYTTAEDSMAAEITTKYGTAEDRISGYGSVKNAEDKDVLTNGSKANRLKPGESTLLDKTIYTQISGGDLIANAEYPIVSETELANVKKEVLSAISGLKLIKASVEQSIGQEGIQPETNGEAGSPYTGDAENTTLWFALAALMIIVGVGVSITGKKEEECKEV